GSRPSVPPRQGRGFHPEPSGSRFFDGVLDQRTTVAIGARESDLALLPRRAAGLRASRHLLAQRPAAARARTTLPSTHTRHVSRAVELTADHQSGARPVVDDRRGWFGDGAAFA